MSAKAVEKTKLIQRITVPIDSLEPADFNPNKMSARAFDLLGDNMDTVGLTENVVAWKDPKTGKTKIMSGHHRWEMAKLKGFEEIDIALITDPEFDEEHYKFQLVRHNLIKGQIDPAGFLKLYEEVAEKYSDEVLQDLFGFEDQKQFLKLVGAMAKNLPKDLQPKFKKAAKEIKTIDGLAQLLNEMFTKYGNTLDHGYMVVDFGGKDSLWVQLTAARRNSALKLAQLCIDKGRTMDDLLGGLLDMAASGQLAPQVEQLIAQSKQVKLTGEYWPTESTVTK